MLGYFGATRGRLRTFRDSEQGNFTVLTLFIMVVVMFVAGMAVDVVRYESRRSKVQNTLDRAILAAADMGQRLPAADVVGSYFEKAGLARYFNADAVHVEIGYNGKRVSATSTGMMDTFFMSMLGIHQLETVAAGTAEESISDIEISLVLDISSSMNSQIQEIDKARCDRMGRPYSSCTYKRNSGETKLAALKDAASEFSDTIFDATAALRTSMSVIPYNQQVNAGPELTAWFNLTTQNTTNHCVDFAFSDFSRAAITTFEQLYRSDVFDDSGSKRTPITMTGECQSAATSRILAWADTSAKVKARINGLVGTEYTSTDIGVKWGAALLDPAARPAAKGMSGTVESTSVVRDEHGNNVTVTTYQVNPAFATRPFDYHVPETMKIMVVMSDGANTDEYRIAEPYQSGPSGVWSWYNPSTKRWVYSLDYPEGNNTDRDNDGRKNERFFVMGATGADRYVSEPAGTWANAKQMTWPEVWSTMSILYHADMRGRAASGNSTSGTRYTNEYEAWGLSGVRELIRSDKNDRMDAACTAAKDNGVVIFSIGFEVTNAAAAVLQKCASSESHFYRVDGLEITTAFQSIANAIGKLRLTQ